MLGLELGDYRCRAQVVARYRANADPRGCSELMAEGRGRAGLRAGFRFRVFGCRV